MTEILSAGGWRTNAELIADVAAMGWLDGLVLDATYGRGNFWTEWSPRRIDFGYAHKGFTVLPDIGLVRNDPAVLDTDSPVVADTGFDARRLPAEWTAVFDAVVFDPPYKLNGRAGSVESDAAYGVATDATFDERMDLILNGSVECARVAKPGGWLHVKAQNQICGGRYIDMMRLIKDQLRDRAIVELRAQWPFAVTPRPQPSGRRQVNPRNNWSVLMSFEVTG